MARSLVLDCTKKGDHVVDPFCGSGVVALEAARNGRCVSAGDWNPYAALLTRAKLFAPANLELALRDLREMWALSRKKIAHQDLRKVPLWVRRFFHPETLRSALSVRDACVEQENHFLLACLLGILHHQRPGFLSFPASHLVPYLRDKKFPQRSYPEMYQERDVLSRLEAKVRRSFRRPPKRYELSNQVLCTDARQFPRLRNIKAVITSPPYMNELDYVRDNRLRLWFIERSIPAGLEFKRGKREPEFRALVQSVFLRLAPGIKPGGYFVIVVGDVTRGGARRRYTSRITRQIFENEAQLRMFHLYALYRDLIPDIRRSRRECRGTKTETILIYKKQQD
jgi:DNA modification methylase